MFMHSIIQHNQRGVGKIAMTAPAMVTTNIRKNIASIKHDSAGINTPTIEYVTTSTLLDNHRLHVINNYWLPSQPSALLPPLAIKLGLSRVKDMVVTQKDFNCQHPS